MVNDYPPALQDVRSAHIKADEHPGRGLVDQQVEQRLQDSHTLDRCRGCRPHAQGNSASTQTPNTCKCGALILIRSKLDHCLVCVIITRKCCHGTFYNEETPLTFSFFMTFDFDFR